MIQHKESFSGIGTVEVRPFQIVDGKKLFDEKRFSKHNLIVKKGRAALLDLLLGVKQRTLKYIRWGKGGTLAFPEGDPLVPLDVNDEDENLKTPVLEKPLSPFNRLSPTDVRFVETIISDEVNDIINEAAMILEEEGTGYRSIFARITFPTYPLHADKGTGIEVHWTFSFTKAEELKGVL